MPVPASVSVDATADLLAAANAGRRSLTIQPQDGDIYFGTDSEVTTSSGMKIPSGSMLEITDYQDDVYAVAASAVDVRVWEVSR